MVRDLPKGPQWASRPAAHRWLGTWLESGALEKVLTSLQEIASIAKMIDFERLAVDGFSSAGKGVTSHVLTDGQGNPIKITSTSAAGDERQQVTPLLKKIIRWLKPIIGSRIKGATITPGSWCTNSI